METRSSSARWPGDDLPSLHDQGDPRSPTPSCGLRELDELEAVFGALANEHRRHILVTLHARGGAMTAGELADRFSHSWSTTTRHLQRLVSAGLVHVERSGRERRYTLDATHLQRLRRGSCSLPGATCVRRLEDDHQLPIVALGILAREVEQPAAQHPAVVRESERPRFHRGDEIDDVRSATVG